VLICLKMLLDAGKIVTSRQQLLQPLLALYSHPLLSSPPSLWQQSLSSSQRPKCMEVAVKKGNKKGLYCREEGKKVARGAVEQKSNRRTGKEQ